MQAILIVSSGTRWFTESKIEVAPVIKMFYTD